MSRMRIDELEIRDADIFEILLDNFPDMIHSVDEVGGIVYTNKTAETLLGYTRDELVKMNIRDLYAEEVLEALEKGFADLKDKGDKSVESLLKAKDGTKIPVEIRSFSIYDDDGAFIRTFSILRDMREIKELQQSLVHAGRLAAIGEMASGVAHDINNPLTVILLSNEMQMKELESQAERGGEDMKRLMSYAADVQKASGSIRKLADHLRNFSRGMAEKYELLDLHSSLDDALFITKNKVQSSRVTASSSVEAGQHFISGLSNHMEQVFVNLIGNACDAMADQEERKLGISIASEPLDDVECWRLDISDTGSGIPKELMDEVFHSFFTTKEKGKGTGLGLSISMGIISDHKGDIQVESKEGQGTTFHVFLPKVERP